MPRSFIILLDSFGIGATEDAKEYGDAGADTLRHVADACAKGKANVTGLRTGPLQISNLCRLGLNAAAEISQGSLISTLPQNDHPQALFGCAKELSKGKDTQSGHWEIAGVPVLFDWGYFSPSYPSFPESLLDELILQAELPGILGNVHASGTVIIEELGKEHQRTGKPIVYTSADSVFQIAAHEESFGLGRLYQVCEVARKLVDPYHIGRVIARPFTGEPGAYVRTGNRRDYATPPHAKTLLDFLRDEKKTVITVGKVADIFAHQGISKTVKAHGNAALLAAFLAEVKNAPDNSLVFVNLVDFDMLYGHRRDVAGYAKALEDFDAWLPLFQSELKPGDLAVITADHGCDPTWPGSDHTREHIPVLVFGPSFKSKAIGKRQTFADIGQSIAAHMGIKPLEFGTSFL